MTHLTDDLDEIRNDLLAMQTALPHGADRPVEAAGIDAAIMDAVAVIERYRDSRMPFSNVSHKGVM